MHVIKLSLQPKDFTLTKVNVWQDKASKRVQIIAQITHPWGQIWELIPLVSQGETRAGLIYARQLSFKLVDAQGRQPNAILERDRWKGEIFDSLQPTIRSWCITCEPPQNQLIYSIRSI